MFIGEYLPVSPCLFVTFSLYNSSVFSASCVSSCCRNDFSELRSLSLKKNENNFFSFLYSRPHPHYARGIWKRRFPIGNASNVFCLHVLGLRSLKTHQSSAIMHLWLSKTWIGEYNIGLLILLLSILIYYNNCMV